MISPTIIGLINNVALLLALGLIYDMVGYRPRGEKPSFQQVLTGLALGTIGSVVMLTPWELTPGLFFDTRSVLLAISGLFFGTIPTLIVIVMTAALRFSIGGSGVWPGIAVIITSGAIGIAWRHLRHRQLDNVSLRELYALGLVVHVTMLLWMLTLPWPMPLDVLPKVGVPVMVIHPVGTTLLGWLMVSRQKRKKTEQALQDSESRYRALFERSSDAIFLVDTDTGRYVDANRAAEHLSGRSLSELQRLSTSDITPQNAPERLQSITELKRNGDMGDVVYLRPDGSERTALLSTVSVQDGLAFGLARDITARIEAETALRESGEKFQAVVEGSIQGILVHRDDKPLFVNKAYANIIGYESQEEILKMNSVLSWLAPYERERLLSYRDARLKGGDAPNRYEHDAVCKDGTVVTLQQIVTVIDWGGKPAILSAVLDITDRKQADEALLESRERYLSLFNNMLDGIYRSTPDGKFVDINPAIVKE